MDLAPDICFRATRARDPRFDGRFFVGIRTTRVYCRPVCWARPARRENQRFFASAAAAESAGFRPCLLCRPELAPGLALVDASRRLAQAAASQIDDGLANEGGLQAVARRLGITERHLRRIFEAEYGVTPVAYAQTARLLLAKRLLTDTQLPVTDVALAAGFGSVRRFNTLFAQRYRMQPTALRRTVATPHAVDHHRFTLATRAPFDYGQLLRFFSRRCIAGVEAADAERFRRSLQLPVGQTKIVAGWIEVRAAARGVGVEVRIDTALTPVLPRVLALTKRAFDIDCHPSAVAAALGDLAAGNPGIRLPGVFDGFELGVRAILGQQVTVAAANTLARRIAERFGASIVTPFPDVVRLFPDASRLAQCRPAQIAELGIVAIRARAIVALARAVAAGELQLDPSAPIEATLAALDALPGVGTWTAHYIAMRALHWPDAFPPGDVGVMKALGERRARAIEDKTTRWRPWRAYAVMHLWNSLETR